MASAEVRTDVRLRDVAMAAVAALCEPADGVSALPEAHALRDLAARVQSGGLGLREALDQCMARPARDDRSFLRLAGELELSWVDMLAVAAAAAVEDDPLTGRLVAYAQAPNGSSRPTLGLLARAFGKSFGEPTAVLPLLLNGPAVQTGLLQIVDRDTPLADSRMAVPVPLCLALSGHDSVWPGATVGMVDTARVPLPESVLSQAAHHALALRSRADRVLTLRTGSPDEGRSVAMAIALALGMRPLFIDDDPGRGLGPWLSLNRLVPVLCIELGPGERRRLPGLAGYLGPRLVLCGPDGAVDSSSPSAVWTLPVPSPAEREALWCRALGVSSPDERLVAASLAAEHRHGAGRIASLGRLSRHQASLSNRTVPTQEDVVAAAWAGEGSGLEAFAEPLRMRVPDEALVVAPALRRSLETLMQRCRWREDLVNGLGPSAQVRYRPGIRALFTGPSGTGKTLAAGWLAARLGLPIYRVDLASLTSKYIGETEKNLSQLLARAEQAEVVLLFDEADSLFAKRTAISDANDRFANAQTNYLLQRIENYDGVVLLTSNSQSRFDDAFARRIDFVIEFPRPRPEERRAIWEAHLGPDLQIRAGDINRLAVLVDLSGGHIRNVVLAAAVNARHAGRAIAYDDLLVGLEAELRKLGRQVPLDLQPARSMPLS